MKKVCTIFAILMYPTLLFAQSSEKKEFDAKNIETIEIENISGDVDIKGDDSGKSTIQVVMDKVSDKCKYEIEEKTSKKILKIDAKFNGNCETNLTLKLPVSINLKVKNISGEISVSHLKAAISLKSISGEVVVSNVEKELDVETTSGDIMVHEANNTNIKTVSVSGDIQVKGKAVDFSAKTVSGDIKVNHVSQSTKLVTISGDIHFEIPDSNQELELEVKSTSGDVRGKFPKDMNVSIEASTSSGDVIQTKASSKDAKVKAKIRSDSGDISIQ